MKDLVAGPAKFTQAMGIDLEYNGVDLTNKKGKLWIEKGNYDDFKVKRTKRININVNLIICTPWDSILPLNIKKHKLKFFFI